MLPVDDRTSVGVHALFHFERSWGRDMQGRYSSLRSGWYKAHSAPHLLSVAHRSYVPQAQQLHAAQQPFQTITSFRHKAWHVPAAGHHWAIIVVLIFILFLLGSPSLLATLGLG